MFERYGGAKGAAKTKRRKRNAPPRKTSVPRKWSPAPYVSGTLLAAGTLLYMILPKRAPRVAMKPFLGRNFAHRGLHTEDKKIPENSLKAFALACEKGYGSELDVRLSADGKVFVFHDASLLRMTGDPNLAETYPWDRLKTLSLAGTEEKIPLFEDVLETVAGREPLIVELKMTKRYKELCEKTLDLLLRYRLKTGGEFCIESFDPRIVRWFYRNAPTVVRGQLSAPAKKLVPEDSGIVEKTEAAVSAHLLTNFLTRPNFIAYRIGERPFPVELCRTLGATLISWTSLGDETEKDSDAVIFQFYEPKPRYK